VFAGSEVTLKKFIFAFMVAAAVARQKPLAAQDEGDPDRLTVVLSDPDRPAVVQVRLLQGSISVTAYDGKDVIVAARSRRRQNRLLRPNPEALGMRRLTGSSLGVDEENNVVSIRSNGFDNPNLEIQVPPRTNLKLESTVAGELLVAGVEGDMEVTNLNGAITLTDVAGSVVAHSTNGKVLVTMKRVTAQKPMAFTSVNGSVDVTLPPDAKANLKLRTMNGDVYTDFDVQTAPAGAIGVDDPRKTRFRFDVERTVLGTINGGGPDYELRSMNGNVYIRRGK
jgi:hypothetical protein